MEDQNKYPKEIVVKVGTKEVKATLYGFSFVENLPEYKAEELPKQTRQKRTETGTDGKKFKAIK